MRTAVLALAVVAILLVGTVNYACDVPLAFTLEGQAAARSPVELPGNAAQAIRY